MLRHLLYYLFYLFEIFYYLLRHLCKFLMVSLKYSKKQNTNVSQYMGRIQIKVLTKLQFLFL